MTLNKELYRQAYELYRQNNTAELRQRATEANKLSSQEALQRYYALWEFAMKLSSGPSEKQHRLHLQELDEYYSKVQKMEAWRQARGKGS
jgi:hypothetical protein